MTTSLSITDHALIRWLERTGAVEIEPLRAALAKSLERATNAAKQIGAGEFLILADGMVYVIRNYTLITVIPDDNRHRHARFVALRETDGVVQSGV